MVLLFFLILLLNFSLPRKRGRKPSKLKINSDPTSLVKSLESNLSDYEGPKEKRRKVDREDPKEVLETKKRGKRPKKQTEKEKLCEDLELSKSNQDEVQCGKCNFKGTRKAFHDHNLRKHVGLGWVEGETPVDLNDEKEVIKLVKAAFKLTKKATCELCQDVKKSFMGFASHIRICGKSEEEKNALKVECPYCSAKCLKYSMPVHIKFSHSSDATENSASLASKEDPVEPSGKRRSALRYINLLPQTSILYYIFSF